MNNFIKDLSFGEKAEKFFLKKAQVKYRKAYREERNANYDICIPEIGKTIECKYDRLSQHTGNIAIEYEYNGKSSGIKKSKADYWGIIFYDKHKDLWKYFLIGRPLLKLLCKELGKKQIGGDGNKSKMYLLNIKAFEDLLFYEVGKYEST